MFAKLARIFAIVILAAVLLVPSAMAEKKPIQLSLLSPIQLFPEETEISGIRLSLLYGKNVSVTGLDWGLVSHTTTGEFRGAQFGVVGLADSRFSGFQNNFINITKADFEGFQWGFVNHANHANGLQLGFFNYARTLRGIQIGLINVIEKGGQFPVFPFVNWSF